MPTYIILSKLSSDAFQDPKEFKKLADAVASRIRKQCPDVIWKQSFATLGRFDVLDVVESKDSEQVARAPMLIRGVWTHDNGDVTGHALEEFLDAV
jgi:uncharacterized protein with GYD domain